MAAVVPPPAHGQPQQHHQRLNKMTDLTDMWQDIESVLLDEGPNACAATAGHPSGGDPLAYHHYHAIHHPIAAHQMSLVHPGFQQHPINHQGATYADVMTGEPVIKNEPVDLISQQTDETSGSYNFGNNAASHHLQYHVQQHHYYPSSSLHHQASPSAEHGGYASRSSTARDCLYQPAASNHHVIHNRASSNPSISSPSPSPNSSNSNSSYAGFGHHHPSAYAYGPVAVPMAVPMAHNGLHHQQGVLAASHSSFDGQRWQIRPSPSVWSSPSTGHEGVRLDATLFASGDGRDAQLFSRPSSQSDAIASSSSSSSLAFVASVDFATATASPSADRSNISRPGWAVD
ncbi:hypothetical protein OUZ56_030670 [Daphnia magna]|uniref:Uncharacterized protein n=1 Tax=Daphnia magna TaxID=35525 RepID=A0ABQ9ZRZ5_9CRUS|nr:hypothetical protein OUZ56_030670 [Daphnia magna]